MKDKLLGHMVKITDKDDPWYRQRGEVIAQVRDCRGIEYIIQFSNRWTYARGKHLKIDE